MNRVDVTLNELAHRMVQFRLGTDTVAADDAAADEIEHHMEAAMKRRKAGTLQVEGLVDWASTRVPWLRRALGDEPEPPRPPPPPPVAAELRRPWAPPAAPGIPAPTPAHQAVAERIIRGDRRPQE